MEARRGEDVIDLGFGNPDLPSPEIAVEKLVEAAQNPKTIATRQAVVFLLREAFADLYKHRFGVDLDPDTEVINTIGAKEGLSHLMWVLCQSGDSVLVPAPSYPIHIFAPIFAGANIREMPLTSNQDEFFETMTERFTYSWPRPRAILLSFPHNPTTMCVDAEFMQRVVDFAREQEVVVVHDLAYADLGFDGYSPPSILQAEGAKEVAVELYSMTKSFSMAGWRVAFMAGNPEIVAALAKMKSYLDYGTFQPIQIAATVTMNEMPDYPAEACAIYESRRNALCDGLARIGWEVEPQRHDVHVGADPARIQRHGLCRVRFDAGEGSQRGALPGRWFGPGGEGNVRFALIENEQRIGQAVRNLAAGPSTPSPEPQSRLRSTARRQRA